MKTDDGAGARKPSDTERATKRIQHFYDADEVAERGEVGSVPATTPYYIHGYGCLCGNCQGSAPNVHATQPEVGSVGQGEPFTQSLQVGLGQVCSECRGTHGVHLAICSRFRKCAKCGSPLLDGLIPPSQTLCGVCRKAEAQPEAGAVTQANVCSDCAAESDPCAKVLGTGKCRCSCHVAKRSVAPSVEEPTRTGIIETCFSCGANIERHGAAEHGKVCPALAVSPEEQELVGALMAMEFCDHFCCDLPPNVCKAVALGAWLKRHEYKRASVEELDAAVQKAAKACAKWVFEVGPEQQKYAEDFYGIIRAALGRKESR